MSVPKKADRSTWHFYVLILGVAQCHFHHALLVKRDTKLCPDSRGGNIDANTLWEKCQGHIVRKACGVGDILQSPLENIMGNRLRCEDYICIHEYGSTGKACLEGKEVYYRIYENVKEVVCYTTVIQGTPRP